MTSVHILLVMILVAPVISAQPLRDSDYSAGIIVLGHDISAILSQLPKPMSVTVQDEPQTGGRQIVNGRDTVVPPDQYREYQFDSLMIQTSMDGLIFCFSVQSTEFATPRGIAIGDSARKVLQLYGEPSQEEFCGMCFTQHDDYIPYCEPKRLTGITFCLQAGRVSAIVVGDCVRL